MKISKLFYVILLILCIGGDSFELKAQKESKSKVAKLPYVMDMVYDNLGLPPRISKFKDSEFLSSLGYNGTTPHWFVQSAITYDSFEKGLIPAGSEERKWIEAEAEKLRKQIKLAKVNNISVYPFTDFLVVPKSLWAKYGKQMVADEFVDNVDSENYRKPDIRKEMTKQILRIQVNEIFDAFPQLDGFMLRFGETYLHDTPYHVGNSPIRGGKLCIEDHIEMIKLLREEVCVKRGKKLLYRNWVHDIFQFDPTTYLAITDQIEPHPNLIFVVKHTHGDFLRTFPFNQILGKGKHSQIVEVQCQREYEGKQAHPNYIAKGVIDGFEEYEYSMKPNLNKSLSDVKDSGILKGVWTWSRGGGWNGPHLRNEFWCEQNAYVMAQWAQNTNRTEEEIFNEFARYKGFSEVDIPKLREISLLSTQAVLRGKYTRFGGYDMVWTRDQYIHGSASLKGYFAYACKNDIIEKVLGEKKESVDMWKRMVQLAGEIHTKDEFLNEYLRTSTQYGRIDYEIIEKSWIIMLLGYIGDQTGNYDKQRIKDAIARYDELWVEWKFLERTSPSCATIYEPNGFAIRGVLDIYGNPATGIGATVDKYRNL